MKKRFLALIGTAILTIGAVKIAYAKEDITPNKSNRRLSMMSEKNINNNYDNMIDIMKENGFKDATNAMENRDFEYMSEFMNNMTDEQYNQMIDIMKNNEYESMSRMMESVDKEVMINMHNSMMVSRNVQNSNE